MAKPTAERKADRQATRRQWTGWARLEVQQNLGRLLIVPVGVAVVVFALNKFVPMSDSEFRTSVAGGVLLVLGGYLAPAIKRFGIGKDGVQFETHDRSENDENRDVGLEITTEVARRTIDIEPDETIESARFFAGDMALASLLEVANMEGATLHLYLFDEDRAGLIPSYELDERVVAQQPWAPGVGAVGKAYQLGQIVFAAGSEAVDETHGLTPQQQAEHASIGLRAVVAVPIFNAMRTVIGVLSASDHLADPPDSSYLATDTARQALTALADACARILVDLLGWFADDV